MKLKDVITAYRASRDYAALAPATKRNTEKAIAKLDLDQDLDTLSKGGLVQLMDAMPPGVAYIFATRMRAVLRFAVERGWLASSPMEGVRLPKYGEYRAWNKTELAEVGEQADPQVRMAALLAFYTAQRMGDVLRMRWEDLGEHDGVAAIHVVQQKTGLDMTIPLHPDLLEALHAHPKLGATIIAMANGQPYNADSFRRKFSREREKLGLPKDMKFHGARKSSACAMALGGASTKQIMGVGGWRTSRQIDHYTKGADQFRLALGAMKKFAA